MAFSIPAAVAADANDQRIGAGRVVELIDSQYYYYYTEY